MSRSPFPSKVTVPDRVRWSSVLAFLLERFSTIDAGVWQERLQSGLVTTAEGLPLKAESPVFPGMRIHYYREIVHEEKIPFEEAVLYEDEHLVVACKPHFLPVIPSGRFVRETLLTRLQIRLGEPDLTPVNRIDRETAGLVLFSRKKETRGLYQSLFMNRQVEKVYEALSESCPEGPGPFVVENRLIKGEPWFRMKEETGEINAVSRIEKVETQGADTLFRVAPLTGKKHQIRLHMCRIGAPIKYDPFYPELKEQAPDDFTSPLKLLSKELRFKDPRTGQMRHFISKRTLFS